MTHPDKTIQTKQKEFLLKSPESERGFYAQLIRLRNAADVFLRKVRKNKESKKGEWMKENLSKEDYRAYCGLGKY